MAVCVCYACQLSVPAGRVKTLHPGVHGGILAIRGNPAHMDAIKQHNIQTIDLVSLHCLFDGQPSLAGWLAGGQLDG